jgi:DNA-directed RNA polymerase specialized sigma24 family protein
MPEHRTIHTPARRCQCGFSLGRVRIVTRLVEVLVAYSHSVQAPDLYYCLEFASVNRRSKRRPVTKRAWSLSDRLNEAQRLAIVDDYLSGATAARLAAAYGLSLSSLKRILRSAQATKIRIGG